MSIPDGWDNEDVFAEYVQLLVIPIFVFWLLLLIQQSKTWLLEEAARL